MACRFAFFPFPTLLIYKVPWSVVFRYERHTSVGMACQTQNLAETAASYASSLLSGLLMVSSRISGCVPCVEEYTGEMHG